MNPELDKQLCEKYPKIFANRYKPMTETAMCWGFECGDGWYNIIDALCANIQGHIDWINDSRQRDIDYNNMIAEAQAGNTTKLDEYIKVFKDPKWQEENRKRILTDKPRTISDPVAQVTADQVKEKFGTLRFYYSGGDEYVTGLSAMAESMSARTCEECGAPGRGRHGGWIRTLCDKHAEEMGYALDDDKESVEA